LAIIEENTTKKHRETDLSFGHAFRL